MVLTEEDKRKIEENRQRAIAIREAKLKQSQNKPLVRPNLEQFKFVPSSSSSTTSTALTKLKTFPGPSVVKALPIAKSPTKSFIKAKCVLISKEKFQIDSPYFPPLIEICRRTETSFYGRFTV